jgi:hypothetical protein
LKWSEVELVHISGDEIGVLAKVVHVRLAARGVPLAGEDAPPTNGFQSDAKAADASEELAKGELLLVAHAGKVTDVLERRS